MIQQSLFPEEHTSKPSWFTDALDTLGIEESSGWPDVFGTSILKSQANENSDNIRILSLFSGGGGLDIGFHDAGYQIVECNELVQDFASTLSRNSTSSGRLHGSKIVCMDINDYDPDVENIDFIIGGPPCQTFSAAGARAAGVNGIDDDRGNLFKQYVRILKKLRPRGFLFENVYRIVGAQGGKPWRLIQEAFSEAGYKLHWRIIDAADFGVPQFRERLIIVGLREGEFLFPYPTHGPDSRDNRPYYTAKQATANVISKSRGTSLGGRHGHLLDGIPKGLNYSFYTDRMGHPTPLFGWRSKFSDYLYKADPDTPVRTIKAQGGQYTGPFHWENRTFTIEELKRLQTFPDDYAIVGNRQKVIHQLGNSVPPQLARVLALSIAQQVFRRTLPFQVELLPESTQLGFRARKNKLTKIYAQKAEEAIAGLPKKSLVDKIPNSSKTGDRYILRDDFTLVPASGSDWYYSFDHEIRGGQISIAVTDITAGSDVRYHYKIEPKRKAAHQQMVSSIMMQSFSYNHQSVTALWKYLERLMQKYFHKDDLVQFFGYYQYSNNYSIQLRLNASELSQRPFWKILTQVSQGALVGNIYSISEISAAYGVDENTLLSELKTMKRLGYEIRNQNTNQQIKAGELLIPYSFPSLNERSLQRLTEL